MVSHWAAYLRAWLHVTPETSVNGNQAELRLRFGNKTFAAIFRYSKKTWTLRHVEIRRGEHTATFTRSELAQAMAPSPQTVKADTGPRTNTTLRERRTTVIRT
jgi:hypothetical protein